MGAYDLHLVGDDTDDTTAISCIRQSAENKVAWYSLSGYRVAEPSVPGIYIEHSSKGVRKVIVK